jgi:hypothetical protein
VRPGFARALVALGCTAGTACFGQGQSVPPTPPSVRCEAPFTVPAGFGVAEMLDDRYIDHIGVRVRLRDNRDRELQFFFGVPGEYGEHAPVVGRRTVYSGESATLFRSPDDNWILSWFTDGPCGSNAIFGHGFRMKREFLGVLEETGLIEPT